jgi:GNAT superfamily N-acetyltransferase
MEEHHIEPAADLFARRYTALREVIPALPARYAQPDAIHPGLRNLLGAGPGVAALRDDELVGYLAGWPIPDFRGRPAVFCPEWAGTATGPQPRRTYEAMYAYLADTWVDDGYTTHLISTLANDTTAIETWHWMGFGYIAVDTIRDLAPVVPAAPAQATMPGLEVREAGMADLDAVVALDAALVRHMAASPIFMTAEVDTVEAYAAIVEDAQSAVWLALHHDEPAAYLFAGPASDDASTVIRAPGTTSIGGAYTQPALRGTGVATALLQELVAWAPTAGYERISVDFEPMNPPAARFWLRHFTPVVYTLSRYTG